MNTLTGTTERGTIYALTVESNIIHLAVALNGTRYAGPAARLEDVVRTSTTYLIGGTRRHLAVPITPEIAAWLDAAEAEISAERIALAAAILRVWIYAGPMSDLPMAWDVDGRRSDEDFVSEYGESFRAPLAEARAQAQRQLDEQATEAARRDTIVRLAAMTGMRQMLSRRMEECDQVDCSSDCVTTYVMPDGTLQVERAHTH